MECTEIRSAVWIASGGDKGDSAAASGVAGGARTAGYWEVCFDNDTDCKAEKIWLATGSRMDAETDPVLQKLLAAHPIGVHCGFLDVGPTLRWAEDIPLYIMGGLAALQLGPDAVNLAGGLRGAVRISAELKERLMGSTILNSRSGPGRSGAHDKVK